MSTMENGKSGESGPYGSPPCAVHGSSPKLRTVTPETRMALSPTELEDASGQVDHRFLLPLEQSAMVESAATKSPEDLLTCSCDSTEFDSILAAIGDKKSLARMRSNGSGPRDYGSGSYLNSRATSASRVKKRVIVSAIANLSTAYNLAVINYAMMMIRRTYPPSSPEVTSTVVSCSLVGAICGQLTFGYIGDAIGRRKGMIVTLLLSICGALASAVLPWGDDTIYPILSVCRFVLGLGVGGVYPLSATTAAESSHDESKNSKIIAAVFSFQGLGQLLAPLVTYLLLLLGIGHGIGWRVLLAAGALPGLFVLKSAFEATETCEYRSGRHLDASSRSLVELIRSEEGLLRKLIGAGMGWFLFDITFYGNVIFTPVILQDTFGFDSNHLKDVARYSLFVAAIGLPGYITTVFVVGRMDFRSIQIMGFTLMALLFAALGVLYSDLRDAAGAMLTLYALTFFFSNFGPNVSTFCLPAEIFPSEARVKLNGIAAASGKIGATVGAALFGMIEKKYGVTDVLVLSAVVSVLGAVVTYYCIPSKKYYR